MFRVGWHAEDTLYWLDQTVQYLRKLMQKADSI